jgi:dTDP-4-amino-4,6-dideoxygalactose transaminase
MPSTAEPRSPLELTHPMPRGPVLDWSSFQIVDAPGIRSIEQLPHRVFTTSGRAAIYQALLQLQLPAQSSVLVPTYHCPTMIAPVLLAGLRPVYYGVRSDALPNLADIDAATADNARAMLVPHYFGLAQSLAEVRAWCDRHGIALIEDCAHCFFGEAGERPAGAWGDFSTASLSKFLPVPEAGLLASAHRRLVPPEFHGAGLKAQIKGGVDVLEFATRYRRLAGLNTPLKVLFKLKNARHAMPVANGVPETVTEETMMRDCDMARLAQRPLVASMVLKNILPRGRIIARRQRNFSLYAEHLRNLNGARMLRPLPTKPVAPYVFPLWVDDADRVYHSLRTRDFPVFRWDRIWPGTPELPGDVGLSWSRHVVQLLCHQDLSKADVLRTIEALRHLLDHP